MTSHYMQEWAKATSEHLRCDPEPRSLPDVVFEAKGYPPRNPQNVFEPLRK